MEETAPRGIRRMSPEEYAAHKNVPLGIVKSMLRNDSRTTEKFDPRDVERHGRKCIRILVTEPNASGFSRPRRINTKKRVSA